MMSPLDQIQKARGVVPGPVGATDPNIWLPAYTILFSKKANFALLCARTIIHPKPAVYCQPL
jgi:hypothetical protein